MKLSLQADEAVLWITCWICITIIACTVIFAIWHYNVKSTKMYTENGYEEVSDKGTSIVYWRKAR